MGSIVAEIADKIASAGGGERSELEIRGGTGAEGGGILTLSTSELTVVDGDKLGRIDFRARAETGADALLVSASIWAEADDVFDASGNETEIVFAVGTAGTAVAAEVVRIDHDGQLGIGVATPASLLHVAGTVQVGVDDTGHDVIFYGDAAGALAMWDTSADSFIVRGATADHATDSAGRIVLQTNQAAVVDGDIIGRIDWNAPAEHSTDGNEVAASIWAEADDTFAADNNSAELVFATGASEIAVERMRIDHDGNVGIGLATPKASLEIYNVTTGAATTDYSISLSDNGGAGNFQRIGFGYATAASQPAYIGYDCTDAGAHSKGDLIFGTRPATSDSVPTERMRIDDAGQIGMGIAPGTRLELFAASATHGAGDPPMKIKKEVNAHNNVFMQFFYQINTLAFSIRSNGSSNSGEFLASSDKRIKKDITPLADSLEKIKTLKPISFKRKEDGLGGVGIGFIAQEYAEIFPADVEKTDDGEGDELPDGVEAWQMSTGNLPVYLTKAIQELAVKVKALEDA